MVVRFFRKEAMQMYLPKPNRKPLEQKKCNVVCHNTIICTGMNMDGLLYPNNISFSNKSQSNHNVLLYLNPPTTSYIQCVMPAFKEAVQRLQKAKFTADILRSLKIPGKIWIGLSGGAQTCPPRFAMVNQPIYFQDTAVHRVRS